MLSRYDAWKLENPEWYDAELSESLTNAEYCRTMENAASYADMLDIAARVRNEANLFFGSDKISADSVGVAVNLLVNDGIKTGEYGLISKTLLAVLNNLA